ncbi:MAG: hypothetical protein NTX85_01050 [Candidatus Nomurabacteria bacterium]|nr:hypothetical protein [Candidatus Nomurabacteria bacterium]
MIKAESFIFYGYKINPKKSRIEFTYRIELKNGKTRTYTDNLFFKNVTADMWGIVPEDVLESTLQSLLLIIGINYWCVFPTKNIKINGFTLNREQADFWNSLYLNGLGEFFYDMKIDFRGLIAFPFDDSNSIIVPKRINLPSRSLLLNGAGKDSILSAEILKSLNKPFDFFAFAPTPAHDRIGRLVGANTIKVTRRIDSRVNFIMANNGISNAYPSVSTFTFVAVLLAELLGYDSIVFSNESSADFGNLEYIGLEVNHQWCKSSIAEKMINDYIHKFITPDISTVSLLRKYNELEIVKLFVQYPKYLHYVTSCNTYFWLPRIQQLMMRKAYWCGRCPKCVFLFACFSAFLPKEVVVSMFGSNLYTKRKLLPYFKRILGIEGFKPLDCVGEPEEMILAMHFASCSKEYSSDKAMKLFEDYFTSDYNFDKIDKKIFKK